MLRHGFRTSAHDTHQPAATGCASSISRLPGKIRRQIPLESSHQTQATLELRRRSGLLSRRLRQFASFRHCLSSALHLTAQEAGR